MNKKYQIKFNRVFPDHRLPSDKIVADKLAMNPVKYFQYWVSGFNATMIKNFQVFAAWYACYILGAAVLYKMWDINPYAEIAAKSPTASFRYIYLTSLGKFGRYDNVTQLFEKDPLGFKDVSYDV